VLPAYDPRCGLCDISFQTPFGGKRETNKKTMYLIELQRLFFIARAGNQRYLQIAEVWLPHVC